MSNAHRAILGAIVCGVSMTNLGCLSGSLAVSKMEVNPPQWTTADKQIFEPGEPLTAQLIIHQAGQENPIDALGLADYCVFEMDSVRYFAGANEAGVFRTRIDVPHAPDGTAVDLRATAYSARGRPDYMDIGGEWIAAESPLNPSDQRIAGDRIRIVVKRAPVAGKAAPQTDSEIVTPAADSSSPSTDQP